jgi:hypothetical protein
MPEMTAAWRDLIEGLMILSRHPTNDISPLHCDPEMLVVMSDANGFTDEEMAYLDSLGFHYNDVHGFHSFRFGSA